MKRRGIPGALEKLTKKACEGLAKAALTTWLGKDGQRGKDRIAGIMLEAAKKGISEILRKDGGMKCKHKWIHVGRNDYGWSVYWCELCGELKIQEIVKVDYEYKYKTPKNLKKG